MRRCRIPPRADVLLSFESFSVKVERRPWNFFLSLQKAKRFLATQTTLLQFSFRYKFHVHFPTHRTRFSCVSGANSFGFPGLVVMEENPTFHQLFEAYRSSYSNSRMTPEQIENLKVWHERRGRAGITLSQADEWMMQAGVIRKKVLSITDTGQTFSRLKWNFVLWIRRNWFLKLSFHRRKFSLSEQQFHDYLKTLCNEKHLDLEEMQSKLLSAALSAVKPDDDSY